MRLHVVEDYKEMSAKAANIVSSQIILKPNSVLGLATGSTPLGMYENLVEMHKRGSVDFSEVITFNLDEYLNLPLEHPQSYHHYMYNNFFDHINIASENINIPPANKENLEEVCLKYDRRIRKAGGIDLQVLGIGVNGHIGFNEPDHKLKTGTHVVDLAKETIEANSRFFATKKGVPRQAISMGMSSIMRAQKILLLASGEQKAQAIKKTISGKITTEVPASLLQLHTDVTIVVDEAAAKAIN
ncbi:glucosamine-6-phosphate isomerase [Halobacteroides halobius DSM 5150]|uniref:Glucosamine-6-phosphate deaminase n=1 Tax=Halobacteroides halobius (strain ATCC 35273 / DSM 5150 / MD-1) TaxID=748449 RepID=L0K9I2_HALHC|nr:glucosamine-6-phosphate deaminase [Halobacteroides halobius]AGB40763.1 glucosamine-6-phosphate isomerase [Halobacteroides halobius DSM 5150]